MLVSKAMFLLVSVFYKAINAIVKINIIIIITGHQCLLAISRVADFCVSFSLIINPSLQTEKTDLGTIQIMPGARSLVKCLVKRSSVVNCFRKCTLWCKW